MSTRARMTLLACLGGVMLVGVITVWALMLDMWLADSRSLPLLFAAAAVAVVVIPAGFGSRTWWLYGDSPKAVASRAHAAANATAKRTAGRTSR